MRSRLGFIVMDSDVLVMGGGFAGLSAATLLAEKGKKVLVLEKKPHLGGRAYSFTDPKTGYEIDNGQHLFIGAYIETKKFLSRIGSSSLLRFSDKLTLHFKDALGQDDLLSAPQALSSPIDFTWGVLNLKHLSLKEKISTSKLMREAKKFKADKDYAAQIEALTIRQWLDRLGQTPNIQERLWEPLAIGILNENAKTASALGLIQALEKILSKTPSDAAKTGYSKVGLSSLYTRQASDYIEKRGGQVLVSSKISSLIYENERVCGVICEDGRQFRASSILLTLPPWDIKRLNVPQWLKTSLQAFSTSPIIGLSLWFDRPITENETTGLIQTRFHWVFNKNRIWNIPGPGQYLSLVISAAHEELKKEPQEILEIAKKELLVFPEFKKAKIIHWRLIKEPFATPSPKPGLEKMRPFPGEVSPGLFLAGDWTRTGLPATIESAVMSGHKAAEVALKN